MSVIGLKTKKYFAILIASGLIPTLFANSTLVKIKSAEGSSVLGKYQAKNVFDNIVSDKSRWVNAKGENKIPELIMNFAKKSAVSGVHLYSGFGKSNAVKDVTIQLKTNSGTWANIIKISNNNKTAVAIKFPKTVNTNALKFIFTKTDDNLARIKEIKVIKATNGTFPSIGAGKTAVKKNNVKNDLWIDTATFPSDTAIVDSNINIPFKSGGGLRFASSFVIFPQSGYAGVHFTDGTKNVLLDGASKSYEMAINGVNSANFYYLIGDNKTIYKNYKALRNNQGFDDIYPKSQLFELGWETWDALGWNTNEKTVKSMLQTFLKKGYPIRWAITGSGFWDKGGTTTSFGKYGTKFPHPAKLKKWMNSNKIAWMIGFRTNLVPAGGPYYPKSAKRDGNLKVKSFNGNPASAEAVRKGYFIKDNNGVAKKYTSGVFPLVPCYLVDGRVKGASKWYLKQFEKWDIDGIKEDTMMNLGGNINVFNGPIGALAKAKANYLIMARCGAFSSPGTLLRINDTGGASSMQRRTPLNYMQYAVCGAPNVYSDTIGFHRMRDQHV